MKFRDRYTSPENDDHRDSTRTYNDLPSKTQQHHAQNCDLNKIMRDYGVTKTLPISAYPPTVFGEDNLDVTLTDAYQTVREADDYFASLPSTLRLKFNHSPLALWRFVNDPANADEAVALGLLKRYDATPSGDASPNEHSSPT